MTSKFVTYIETLFSGAVSSVEAAWQSTETAVETIIKNTFAQDLPAVLAGADKAVLTAAAAGGTGDQKWQLALSIFTDVLKGLNLESVAVNVIETVLQMAVTKLESVKAA